MTRILTSETDPLQVDFVDPGPLPPASRLGLTFAPGKWDPYSRSGYWQRDLAMDLARLRDHYHATTLLTLMEGHELDQFKISDLRGQTEAAGLEWLWFPIRDVSIPADPATFSGLVGELRSRLAAGGTLVVHCLGGRGRSGLVASCCLTTYGLPPDDAIRRVRAVRHGAVETREQERFVAQFAKDWNPGNT